MNRTNPRTIYAHAGQARTYHMGESQGGGGFSQNISPQVPRLIRECTYYTLWSHDVHVLFVLPEQIRNRPESIHHVKCARYPVWVCLIWTELLEDGEAFISSQLTSSWKRSTHCQRGFDRDVSCQTLFNQRFIDLHVSRLPW